MRSTLLLPSGNNQPHRPSARVALLLLAAGAVLLSAGCGTTADKVPGAQAAAQKPDEPVQISEAREAIDSTLLTLIWGYEAEILAAVEEIGDSGDETFAPPLVDLIHATFLGIYAPIDPQHYVRSLERITGKSHGLDWPEWVRWVGQENPGVPRGYLEWKGRLWGRIDPVFVEFLSGDSAIRPEEILWGGVTSEGIPALVDSPVVDADIASSWLEPDDLIFGAVIADEARAYPLRILDWHEMANDTIGGVPVTLSYCTLCGAAILYDRRIGGREFLFRTSGLLYRSNKLMYDAETRSLWNQFTGRPVVGDLVQEELRLRQLPLVLTSWEEWRSAHPETTVLSIDTGYDRDYTPGAAYGHYFSSPDAMFPIWSQSEALPDKTLIYGIRVSGRAKAYPLDRLSPHTAMRDDLGSARLLVIVGDADLGVRGADYTGREVDYLAGGQVRVYRLPDEAVVGEFEYRSADTLVDSKGRHWAIAEDALTAADGLRAPRLSGNLSYWFAWSSFFSQTEIF